MRIVSSPEFVQGVRLLLYARLQGHRIVRESRDRGVVLGLFVLECEVHIRRLAPLAQTWRLPLTHQQERLHHPHNVRPQDKRLFLFAGPCACESLPSFPVSYAHWRELNKHALCMRNIAWCTSSPSRASSSFGESPPAACSALSGRIAAIYIPWPVKTIRTAAQKDIPNSRECPSSNDTIAPVPRPHESGPGQSLES
jgi:hypothetical protein